MAVDVAPRRGSVKAAGRTERFDGRIAPIAEAHEMPVRSKRGHDHARDRPPDAGRFSQRRRPRREGEPSSCFIIGIAFEEEWLGTPQFVGKVDPYRS